MLIVLIIHFNQVKQTARRNLTRSAAEIVETLLKESTTHNDVPLPKPDYLARIANHHRQQMRPKDPSSVDYVVDIVISDDLNIIFQLCRYLHIYVVD